MLEILYNATECHFKTSSFYIFVYLSIIHKKGKISPKSTTKDDPTPLCCLPMSRPLSNLPASEMEVIVDNWVDSL